jgi:hypothetical protein
MNDRLDRSNPGYPPMKRIEGSKIPASQPETDVISTCESPEKGKVCDR